MNVPHLARIRLLCSKAPEQFQVLLQQAVEN